MKDIYRDYVFKTCLLSLTHARNINELRDKSQQALGFSSRFLSYLLHPEDTLIYCGMSRTMFESQGKLKKRKEHVVPFKYFWEYVWDCLEQKIYSDEELAKLMFKNLHLAIISEEECQRLDTKPLNLKTKMPDGWIFGDDPILRLHAADIVLVDDKGNEINTLLI